MGISVKSSGNNDGINLGISAMSRKIHIDNNWTDVKTAGICTGNGTYSDPYIIKNLVIDGWGSGPGILIENSTVYFKIENCTIFNTEYYSLNAGIKLQRVNNGLLINNNCSSNPNGLFLDYSYDNTILGNYADNNIRGIYLLNSYDNTIRLCRIANMDPSVSMPHWLRFTFIYIPQFAKTVIMSGLDMFHSMGLTLNAISDEMKGLMKRAKEGKPLILAENSEHVENEKEVISLTKKQKGTLKASN